MPKRVHQTIERIIIAAMLLGIVGMFQPWSIHLYGLGFHVLLIGTLSFIVFSKVPFREEE